MKRVLLVEDEGIIAKHLQKQVEGLGYAVCGWASTGEEAVALANSEGPDLILMDIQLKGPMDGVEAAGRILEHLDVPVIYLTAHADRATLARAKITQPFGYILKPFDERDLSTALELALHKHEMGRLVREREQWLSTTLKSLGEAVITTDREGRITFVNPAAEAIIGWSCDEARLHGFAEVFRHAPEDPPHSEESPLDRALQEGAVAAPSAPALLETRDGRHVPIEECVAPIRDDAGRILGAALIFRDISEKRRSEARLKALLKHLEEANDDLNDQKGFLSALFEADPNAIMVVDALGKVKMSNRALQRAFGPGGAGVSVTSPGDLLQCTQAFGKPAACGEVEDCQTCQIWKAMLDAISGQEVLRKRAEFQTGPPGKSRDLVLLVSAAPLEFKGERLAMVILEDVTELHSLRKFLKADGSFAGIVGKSRSMLEIYEAIKELAEANVPVLVQGESGTGKELAALAIHALGPRAERSFVAVNCGALPDGLIESELFGHVKGSFTGAIRDKKGRFELADGGTIFLDEVGDLSPAMQVKLLRVLQTGTFERVGGERTVSVNVRVISATHKDLQEEMKKKRFREDLFYRLSVVPILMPPLRERATDIPLLAEHFLEKAAALSGLPRARISSDALSALMDYPWPGNVRELQNALEYALIKSKGQPIDPGHLPATVIQAGPPGQLSTRRSQILTAQGVRSALQAVGGNRVKAAKVLGVSRATLYRFLDKEG